MPFPTNTLYEPWLHDVVHSQMYDQSILEDLQPKGCFRARAWRENMAAAFLHADMCQQCG